MTELNNANCIVLDENDIAYGWNIEIINGNLLHKDLEIDHFNIICQSSIERADLAIFSHEGFDKIIKVRY